MTQDPSSGLNNQSEIYRPPSPMIGRESELRQLQQAASHLLAHGRGQFALLTGEAGLGKSRLAVEFKSSLDSQKVAILEGQSQAYHRVSYWLIRDVLYDYLGLSASTPPLEVRERLSQDVNTRLGLTAAEGLAYLEHLMALPYSDPEAGERLKRMEPGQLRQQVFLAVRDLLLADIARRPLVLILDDLHQADDASLDLLSFLLDTLHQVPLFILAISGPLLTSTLEKLVNWSRQNLGDRFHEIPLQSLPLDQSRQLLQALVPVENLPRNLQDQVLQRAAGVPFYFEELQRLLVDQDLLSQSSNQRRLPAGVKVASLVVPETPMELILARFDRLPPALRRVLQAASVIGKDFDLPVLAPVLPPNELADLSVSIAKLVERGFILPPASADTAYAFRHIFISDAIYSTLAPEDRRALHGQVAETIMQMCAERLDVQVELLAYHYCRSASHERALRFAVMAGEQAARNQVNQQAVQYYETALGLMKETPYTPIQGYRVCSGMGDTQMFFGEYPEARAYYQQALQALAGDADHRYIEERSSLYRKIARTHERQGDYGQAVNRLSQAQETLDLTPGDYPVERAQVWNDWAWIYYRQANVPEAQDMLLRALALVENSEAYEVIASIYNRLAGLAFNQGNWEKSSEYSHKSIAIREATRDLTNLATSYMNLGALDSEMGKLDSALKNMLRGYEIKARLGQSEGIAMALNNLGWLRIQRGELEDARHDLEKARDLTEQIGYTPLHRLILKNLGELYLASEEWPKAQEFFVQYLRTIAGTGAQESIADCYRLLGETALGAGDIDTAVKWTKKAGEQWELVGESRKKINTVERGESLRLRGMVALQQGNWLAAQAHFADSQAIFRKIRSLLYETRVIYHQGRLAKAQGDQAAALELFTSAANTFRSLGARLDAKRAEQQLRNLAQ